MKGNVVSFRSLFLRLILLRKIFTYVYILSEHRFKFNDGYFVP